MKQYIGEEIWIKQYPNLLIISKIIKYKKQEMAYTYSEKRIYVV